MKFNENIICTKLRDRGSVVELQALKAALAFNSPGFGGFRDRHDERDVRLGQ